MYLLDKNTFLCELKIEVFDDTLIERLSGWIIAFFIEGNDIVSILELLKE
jgi:hypothetical protein